MFKDIPVDAGPMHEGERIRAMNMFVERGLNLWVQNYYK